MNIITYNSYKLIERIYIKTGKAKAFKTKYGIKNFNMRSFVNKPSVVDKETILFSADDLFLGYDFLNDDFTLIDVPIKSSPHYHLIKCLYDGDVSGCDYIQRWLKGTLDWRFGFKKPRNYSFFTQKFEQAKENITNDQVEPVIIYRVGEKNYIYDGKHRTAMCAYNNILVPCKVIEPELVFSGVWETMFEMIINDIDYQKHHTLFRTFKTGGSAIGSGKFNNCINDMENA